MSAKLIKTAYIEVLPSVRFTILPRQVETVTFAWLRWAIYLSNRID